MSRDFFEVPDGYISIPFPVDPADRQIPTSIISIPLSNGRVATIVAPIQGSKTIENLIATCNLWKPALVVPELDYQI